MNRKKNLKSLLRKKLKIKKKETLKLEKKTLKR